MTLKDRIYAFSMLGEKLNSLNKEELASLIDKTKQQNPWFLPESIQLSLTGIRKFLQPETLVRWTSRYKVSDSDTNKVIALVLAGNIPLVGFHDLLCVLISGHTALIKLSSKDIVLLPAITNWLIQIEPAFKNRILYTDQLKSFDAVIATGSDNAARYFDYYFGKYPHIIRKNRTSCAILTGNETEEELELLGHDVFSYFGLGCRNVSKLFVPENYEMASLINAWKKFTDIIHHHKYFNNYDYQKAILIMNKEAYLDSGFVLLVENTKMVSPIAVVYYERYKDVQSVTSVLADLENKIQCVVGQQKPATIPFGKAQFPEVWDYADGVDTMEFLNHSLTG